MKLKAKITGSKVHEVGYRVFLLVAAFELGIQSFAAYNRKDNGKQMVLVQIEGDEGQLKAFQEFADINKPEGAEVSELVFEEHEGHVMGVMDYIHLVQMEQLNKGIPALLRIEGLQRQMLDKQDQMLDKQDQMLDKQDQMLDKQDQMLCKLDESRDDIVGEIRDLRTDLKSSVEERLGRIETDVSMIKTKIGL
jgi:acylphosphatase